MTHIFPQCLYVPRINMSVVHCIHEPCRGSEQQNTVNNEWHTVRCIIVHPRAGSKQTLLAGYPGPRSLHARLTVPAYVWCVNIGNFGYTKSRWWSLTNNVQPTNHGSHGAPSEAFILARSCPRVLCAWRLSDLHFLSRRRSASSRRSWRWGGCT